MSPMRTRASRFAWFWIALVLFVGPLGATSCGQSESSSASSHAAPFASEQTELEDGSYSCEATNTSRGNGPYTLDCDKSGDSITLHFSNGGYIVLDIDSQESTGDGSWEISATHSESGDSWDLSIDE